MISNFHIKLHFRHLRVYRMLLLYILNLISFYYLQRIFQLDVVISSCVLFSRYRSCIYNVFWVISLYKLIHRYFIFFFIFFFLIKRILLLFPYSLLLLVFNIICLFLVNFNVFPYPFIHRVLHWYLWRFLDNWIFIFPLKM